MFNYFFFLFVFFNKIKTNVINLNAFNKNLSIDAEKFKIFDGNDNRNLTIHDIDVKNFTILFYKYELLKKLKNDKYNIPIHPINILNGRLLKDFEIV